MLYVVNFAGTVKRGVITPNTSLLLGPDIGDGSFKAAAIKSIVSVSCLHDPASIMLLIAWVVGTANPSCAADREN
jgi:GTPase